MLKLIARVVVKFIESFVEMVGWVESQCMCHVGTRRKVKPNLGEPRFSKISRPQIDLLRNKQKKEAWWRQRYCRNERHPSGVGRGIREMLCSGLFVWVLCCTLLYSLYMSSPFSNVPRATGCCWEGLWLFYFQWTT